MAPYDSQLSKHKVHWPAQPSRDLLQETIPGNKNGFKEQA